MTTSPVRGGSRISARNRAPSVNLSKLVEILSKSISAPTTVGLAGLPLLSALDGKVRINTRGVLERLMKHPDFQASFTPGEESGFLRDAEPPPFGTTAKMGGRMLQGTEAATAKSIDALHDVVSNAVDAALAGVDLTKLTKSSFEAALKIMASTIGAPAPEFPQSALMVPVKFAEPGRPASEREKDIGRVLSGIETVDGRDWLELILSGIARKLRQDNEDEDDIGEIVSAIRLQSTRPGTQIRAFLEFLEDEALARVRLHVTMRLMEAVAAQSNKPGFKSYVQRVRECFESFAGAEGEPLTLEVGAVYGVANNTNLAEQLRKAMFYNCLPVWGECAVQLFERRIDPAQNQPTVREVSYRFRVNGMNPSTGQSSFDSRLNRLFDRTLAMPGPTDNVKRSVAELVFLSLVVPDSLTATPSGSVAADAAAIAASLKTDPVGTLTRLHKSLLARSRVMEDLADELIAVLKTKSTALVTAANRSADKFMVTVHKDIIDWDAVKGMSSANVDILVKSDKGSDNIAWFSHIRVSEKSWPGSVASFSVDTELQERSLTPAGDAVDVKMARSLATPVLPVRFLPFKWDKAAGTWLTSIPRSNVLDAGCGIEVEFELRLLELKRVKDDEKGRSEQLRSAVIAAFSLVTYVTLWELTRRIKALVPDLTMTLVRLQHTGKGRDREADGRDGNTAVYAISQALEKALTRELPVKLQGLTTANDEKDSIRWKNRGALSALLGGQPVRFQKQGALNKVAVVSYVTRPCDLHPAFPDADGYLFVNRTYVADSENGETTLRVDRMLSRLVESRTDFHTPHLILEEIARLRKAGYEHILLLSHHFGNRHIGRAAERHAPHGTLEFLDEAAKRFPDVHLYPLRRDVFPATRLRKRTSQESGFEVLRHDAHREMYLDGAKDVLRSMLPVYTFATLHVVGDEGRPQSGFCTYFFDAENRLSDFNLREATRANILGTGSGDEVRQSLVSVLRAIHFLESEKPSDKTRLLPVLDPFDWATPTTTAGAGEVEVVSRRGGRSILLSMPALLAHVTKVLHREALSNE